MNAINTQNTEITACNSRSAARNQDKLRRKTIYKGIIRGALAFGATGFLSGVGVCVAYRLPVPPLAVTECGALFGALLGALWGVLASDDVGRKVLQGIYLGIGAAIGLALVAPWALKLPAALAALCLGAYLGYQNGVLPQKAAESWKMHRG